MAPLTGLGFALSAWISEQPGTIVPTWRGTPADAGRSCPRPLRHWQQRSGWPLLLTGISLGLSRGHPRICVPLRGATTCCWRRRVELAGRLRGANAYGPNGRSTRRLNAVAMAAWGAISLLTRTTDAPQARIRWNKGDMRVDGTGPWCPLVPEQERRRIRRGSPAPASTALQQRWRTGGHLSSAC